MKEEIYIVEALKEFPILKARIEKNSAEIQKYASGLSNMTPYFKTPETQAKEVASLLQSTKDLVARYLWLKRCLAYTNAVLKLEIDKRTYSIAELILIVHRDTTLDMSMGDCMSRVYDRLNDFEGKQTFSKFNLQSMQGEPPKVVLFYDEQKKNAERNAWGEFVDKITAKLEIFNARTLLLDPEDAQVAQES